MSSKSSKLVLSKVLCRFGMLLAWLVAATNIMLTLQSDKEIAPETSTESSDATALTEMLSLNQFAGSDSVIQIAGISISSVHINIGMSLLLAIIATAILAMAIAIIDLRNIQARRSRH